MTRSKGEALVGEARAARGGFLPVVERPTRPRNHSKRCTCQPCIQFRKAVASPPALPAADAELVRVSISQAASITAGHMKPTKEARAQAEFEEVAADVTGAKHYRRRITCSLDMMHLRGSITRQQCEAGKRYDADHRLVWGSSGRDSTIPPLGGMIHETNRQAEANISARARMDRVLKLCGPVPYAVLRSVAAYDERIGRQDSKKRRLRYDALRAGLDAAAEVYAVPVYADNA